MSAGAAANSHTVAPRMAARMLGEIVKYVRASDRVLPMVAMQLDTNAIGPHSLRITASDGAGGVRARIPLSHAPTNTDGEPIDSYRWPVQTTTLDRAVKALRGATGADGRSSKRSATTVSSSTQTVSRSMSRPYRRARVASATSPARGR